jgi:hypothetical protein
MAGFNKVKQHSPNAISHEGGAVYEKSPVNAWMNMLFSSFMEDKFYESGLDQQKRFIELTNKMAEAYGYEFVAKAAVFARNELGMRSISQLVAAWLNNKTFDNKRQFYRAFMHRPDDVAEIFAAVDFLWGKKSRSHALVRGAADYLRTIKPQTLAKYKLNSRDYNMYDRINITHAYSKAINDYKNDRLVKADTWEVKIAGAENVEQKNQEWHRLIEEHKLGYMALIRNLNNILDSGVDQDWIDRYLVPQIIDQDDITKSLMFPYRFYTAYKNLNTDNLSVTFALGKAFAIAAKHNAPQLQGASGIMLDVSGSMEDPISYRSNITIKEVGACFAVALLISNPNCAIVKFGTTAKTYIYSPLDNPFTSIKQICANDGCGYGTNIVPALYEMSKYIGLNRIFIISDMQVMDSSNYTWNYYRHRSDATKVYNTEFKDLPLYSFDLGNYRTQIKSPNDPKMHYITALNDQVFKFIGLLESGINLVDYINSFSYC